MVADISFRIALDKDCSDQEAFWTTDGTILHNLYELIATIAAMSETSFRYHVNTDNNKNDFADWVRDVYGDDELAKKLEGVMDRARYARILKKRLKEFDAIRPKNL